jgi:hypothetical protein
VLQLSGDDFDQISLSSEQIGCLKSSQRNLTLQANKVASDFMVKRFNRDNIGECVCRSVQ